MTFEQMNESTPDQPAPGTELQTDGELAGEGELGGGAAAKKPNTQLMLLGGLAVVGAAVIWFMFFRGSPPAAQAALPASGGNDIKQFLDSGNINLMKQTLKDSEKIVQQFQSKAAQTQIPLASLKSNPFRELTPKGETQAPKTTDDDEAREHARIVAALGDLHLQTVIRAGRRHTCMINNTVYSEGEQVGIFSVQEVRGNSVVLGSGKYRFELPMAK